VQQLAPLVTPYDSQTLTVLRGNHCGTSKALFTSFSRHKVCSLLNINLYPGRAHTRWRKASGDKFQFSCLT